MELTAWFDPDAEDPMRLRTVPDVDALLDHLRSWPGPNLAELSVVGRPELGFLNVGVDAERGRGVLGFSGDGDPDLYVSQGTPDEDGETIYYYMDQDTEFPSDAELSLDSVRNAACEYLNSGGRRPKFVEWQHCP